MDDKTLRKIFPAEIWLQIIEAGLHNVSKIYYSSPFFGKLILQCRVHLLLSAVLPTVLNYLPDKESTTKILQDSRLVCRSWNKITTKYVQEKMKLCTETSEIEGRFPEYLDPFCVTFSGNIDSISAYQKHFELSHFNQNANPFVFRHLKLLYVNLGPHAAEYSCELEKLLAKRGHHVWYFSVSASVGDVTEDFSRFRKTLDQLPNLKGITILLTDFRWNKNRGVQRDRVPAFPTYPKLECLKVGGNSTVCLLSTLLTNNRHIKILHRECWEYEQDELYCEPMPNLENLKLTCFSFEDFESLENLQHTWPLKQLEIRFCGVEDIVSWKKMEKCFKVLEEKFGDTLQNLHFDFPKMNHFKPFSCALKLPKLTSLTLEMPIAYLLDFILPLKENLVNLNVSIERPPFKKMTENAIQFFSVSNNLLHSNIWSLFPKLQTVTFVGPEEEAIKRTYKRSDII